MAKASKQHEVEDILTRITKKLEQFISKHLKVIILTIAVVAVGLGVYFSLDYWFKRREEIANSAFGKVYLIYRDIIDNEGVEKEEVNKELLDLNEQFKLILEEYPKSSAAFKSAYFIGNTLYKIGSYNDAIEYFKKGYSKGSKTYISILCFQGEASCYEQLEEYEKAETVYRGILDQFDGSFIVPLIKFNLGQLYEKQDRFEMAKREYSQIVSDYEWSSWKGLAEKRLLLIKSFI